MRILLYLTAVFFPGAGYFQPAQKPPLTVCEVLSKLTAYADQRVSIRGELLAGEEVTALVGRGCPQLVTDGYRWPSPALIALTYPNSRGDPHPRVSREPVKVEHVDAATLKAAGPTARIYVTVSGRLDTRAKFEMVRLNDGTLVPYGFGHLNVCPAQVVYDEMKDVTVVPGGEQPRQ